MHAYLNAARIFLRRNCPPPRHNFASIPRIRSERPAFDLNHPEAGLPVGVGPAKDAPQTPVVDVAQGEVK